MEQSGIQEILKALKLQSTHIDEKLNEMKVHLENHMENVKTDLENRMENVKTDLENRMENVKTDLENRMDERFDRIEAKLNGFRVELTETQETVDYLTIKSAQHEKKLRNQVGQ
jgi:hypothetical protein